MRRSAQVAAPLLAAAALAINTGCRKPEMQRCVDEHNVVVDDKLCANLPPGQQGTQQGIQQQRPDGHGGFIPFIFPYHYYYGGLGGYALGSMVSGGSYTPSPNRSYATAPATSPAEASAVPSPPAVLTVAVPAVPADTPAEAHKCNATPSPPATLGSKK